MEYEDTITIPTPEGIELEYTLAGVGSRFIAELVDLLLRLVALTVLLIVLYLLGGGTLALVVFLLAVFLAMFVYDVAFEALASGRTPGKRWSGLRVVMIGGGPVRLGSSAVRSLLRLIDQWITLATVGLISVQTSSRNQRLGDLAGGTIVIRERKAKLGQAGAAALAGQRADVDVTAITADELTAVRDFLARRDSLTGEARTRVGQALAASLGPKVGGLPPGGLSPEALLETIAAAKSASRYGSPER